MTSEDRNKHILYFKEQVLRFAAEQLHKHKTQDIEGLEENFAPKNHKSTGTDFGQATANEFGHVKVENNINDNTTSENPASSTAIVGYIKGKIDSVNGSIENILKNYLNKNSIETQITSNSTHNKVPTSKAVIDAMSSYEHLLDGISLSRPKNVEKNIDDMIEPGYYKQIKKGLHFSYGGETIYYTNALIKIERQSNRIIQHVYATNKVTANGKTTYKINGSEYTRWGLSNKNWGAWHVAHKPYTKTTRAKIDSTCPNVNKNSVIVYENTAGFIIHWDQDNSQQDQYLVSANLYSYANVCKFDPPLPIKGPYVFGNLIGRMDIKITSDKMQIRTNVTPNGRIIEMHETYFVPRNQ